MGWYVNDRDEVFDDETGDLIEVRGEDPEPGPEPELPKK